MRAKWRRATALERTLLILALPLVVLGYFFVYLDNRTGDHPVIHLIGTGLAPAGAYFAAYFFLGERMRESQRRRRQRAHRSR